MAQFPTTKAKKRKVVVPSEWLEACPEVGLSPSRWREITARCRSRGIRKSEVQKVRRVAIEVMANAGLWKWLLGGDPFYELEVRSKYGRR